MNPEDDRFGGSLNRCRGPNIPDHVKNQLKIGRNINNTATHKNKQFSFSLGGGGVLKIGITTDGGAGADGNCCKQDGPSLLASTVLALTRATGGFHR
jgi:hypothetical protein